MKPSDIELIGVFATIGGAIWAYVKGQDAHKALVVANVALLGVCLTILVSFRFDLIPQIQKQQELSDKFLNNENGRKLLQCYLDGARASSESPDSQMKKFSTRYYQDFVNFYQKLAEGSYTVNGDSLLAFSQDYIAMAEKEIIATSYVIPSGWWRGEGGRQYQEANKRLIDKGVSITRFFIVDNEKELKEIKDLIASQLNIKVKVFVIIRDKNLKYKHTEDLILIDGKMGGRLVLSSNREPVKADMTTNSVEIQRIRTAIDEMSPYASTGESILKQI